MNIVDERRIPALPVERMSQRLSILITDHSILFLVPGALAVPLSPCLNLLESRPKVKGCYKTVTFTMHGGPR